jgi:hypothetical protein
MSSATWRPPQWNNNSPAKVIINFPGQAQPTQYSNATGSTVTLPSVPTLYAFDAEISIEHEQRLTRTEHPIQTGAAISDHAFIQPARLVLDILMTDTIAAYYSPSTWQGSPSKSVSAFQTMLALMFSRIPLTITTRLRTYNNMVIEGLIPRDTVKTGTALRMTVEFGQIFVANVTVVTNSARPQDTQTTNLGTVNPTAVPTTVESQNNVQGATISPSASAGLSGSPQGNVPGLGMGPTSPSALSSLGIGVDGSGNFSSVNVINSTSLSGPK